MINVDYLQCADKKQEWAADLRVLSLLEVYQVLPYVEVKEQGSTQAQHGFSERRGLPRASNLSTPGVHLSAADLVCALGGWFYRYGWNLWSWTILFLGKQASFQHFYQSLKSPCCYFWGAYEVKVWIRLSKMGPNRRSFQDGEKVQILGRVFQWRDHVLPHG